MQLPCDQIFTQQCLFDDVSESRKPVRDSSRAIAARQSGHHLTCTDSRVAIIHSSVNDLLALCSLGEINYVIHSRLHSAWSENDHASLCAAMRDFVQMKHLCILQVLAVS